VMNGFTNDQQEEIKKALPSFKEKMAFVDALKKRWREQKGYCSVFDRIRAEKLKKEKVELKAYVKSQRRQMLRRRNSQENLQPRNTQQLNTIGLPRGANDDIFYGQGSIDPGAPKIKKNLVFPANAASSFELRSSGTNRDD